MRNIVALYKNYSDQVEEFGGEKIVSRRIDQISNEMKEFIKVHDLESIAEINEVLLFHAVLDYFSDIQRLKVYQDIKNPNEIKIKAYETAWLLRRKPIQLTGQLEDDRNAFLNERFNLLRLASFMMGEDMYLPINSDSDGYVEFEKYMDSLLYYFKFRQCDPQSIEIMLLGFSAGRILGRLSAECRE